MWYECECALDLVLDPFLTNFGANLGSQNCSKNGPKIDFFGSIFKTLFYEVLKLFKCLLGAFPSLLCSSWQPPRREKYGFPIVKWHFLKMMLFGALRLLMSSLGSSWHLLAHSCPKINPKMDPKSALKSVKKRPQNCSNFTCWGSFWTPSSPIETKKSRAHFVPALLVQLQIS